jgi:hypothetical protein
VNWPVPCLEYSPFPWNTRISELVDVIIAKTKVCKAGFTGRDAVMYLDGLSCLRIDGPHLRELLSALLPLLKSNQESVGGGLICKMLFELRGMSSESVEIRAILQFLGEHLAKMTSRKLPNTFIGQALYGIQNMSDEHVEVRNLLRTLTTLLSQLARVIGAAFISISLSSLRAMNHGSDEASGMVNILSSKWPYSSHSYNGDLVAGTVDKDVDCGRKVGDGTIYDQMKARIKPAPGFRVRGIDIHEFNVAPTMFMYIKSNRGALLHPHLSDVSDIVALSVRTWSAVELSCLLNGIKAVDVNNPALSRFLESILVKAKQSTDQFESSDIARSLLGLSSLDEGIPHVAELLSLLLAKARLCPTGFEANEISRSLHGLQSMSSDSGEVRALLDLFSEHLEHVAVLSPSQIGLTLYGLRNMSSEHTEVYLVLP